LKYYCANCGTEVIISGKSDEGEWPHHYPLCLDDMKLLPDFGTVAQWEKRTGEKLGEDAWVWRRASVGNGKWGGWELWEYRHINKEVFFNRQILVPNGPYAPPNNYTSGIKEE
jgi:hypothetical protein